MNYSTISDILDVLQSENDLKSSNLLISCPDDKLNTKISLLSAASNYNNRTTATSKICKCVQSGFACTTHCHPFNRNCINVEDEAQLEAQNQEEEAKNE